MPLQARILILLALLLSSTSWAKSACELDLRDIEAKLGAAGIWVVPGGETPVKTPEGKPEFSDVALETGVDGQVKLLLLVAPDGAVADRVVLCAEPFGYFQPAVLEWAKRYAYPPIPTSAPRPYPYRAVLLTVNFRFEYASEGSRITR